MRSYTSLSTTAVFPSVVLFVASNKSSTLHLDSRETNFKCTPLRHHDTEITEAVELQMLFANWASLQRSYKGDFAPLSLLET